MIVSESGRRVHVFVCLTLDCDFVAALAEAAGRAQEEEDCFFRSRICGTSDLLKGPEIVTMLSAFAGSCARVRRSKSNIRHQVDGAIRLHMQPHACSE